MALIRPDNSIPVPALLKRFALIYLPIVMVLSVALLMGIRLEEQTHVKEIEEREIAKARIAQVLVMQDIAAVDSDLRIFAKLPLLRWYLDSGNPAQREELEKLFLVLAQEMRRCDQVRYLDASGQEVIRIIYNDGKPAIVPREQLQNKKRRYYFDDTFKLNQGEVFVSPLDLNIEHGSLEIPYKPVIRFGTPVFDSAGRKKGIILFNYLGDNLLQHFHRATHRYDSQDMLLNRDGYWLSGAKPEDEWGFMLGKNERTFGHDFAEAWRAISAAERGTLRTDQGLFVYATVYPLENLLGEQYSSTGSALVNAPSQQYLTGHEYYWKIVSFVPHDVLSGAAYYNQTGNRIALAVVYLLFALGAWAVASVTLSRKRAEEMLRESETRFRALVDAAGDMIFTIKADGEVRYVNEMAARALDAAPEQVAGKYLRDLFPPETFEQQWRNLQKVFETGEPLYMEAPIRFPHGEVWLSTWLTPLRDASGSIVAVLGASRDITERKRAEEAVRRLNDELEQKVIARTAALDQAKLEVEQASRGKDEFLAAISHELKTPLNHILGFADLLKEGLAGGLNAEQQGMAQDIFDAGNRQLALVNSLIELARLQAGKVTLQARPENAAKLLGEIAALHAAKAEAAGLTFAVELAQGLGEMPLDREMVTHLLDQLLENAFKFTPSSGKVSLAARRVPRTDVTAPLRSEAGEYLELAVADNGPSIAPEILPRLFQPFVQGDGRLTRSHGGTGIGLTLVKLLAELHGGGSGVESEPGNGAKFLVWLPCGAADVGTLSPATLPQGERG